MVGAAPSGSETLAHMQGRVCLSGTLVRYNWRQGGLNLVHHPLAAIEQLVWPSRLPLDRLVPWAMPGTLAADPSGTAVSKQLLTIVAEKKDSDSTVDCTPTIKRPPSRSAQRRAQTRNGTREEFRDRELTRPIRPT